MQEASCLVTVPVPERVELEDGCRPGCWTFFQDDAVWTAQALNEEGWANAELYDKNLREGGNRLAFSPECPKV